MPDLSGLTRKVAEIQSILRFLRFIEYSFYFKRILFLF
jgi:hypothetical protein